MRHAHDLPPVPYAPYLGLHEGFSRRRDRRRGRNIVFRRRQRWRKVDSVRKLRVTVIDLVVKAPTKWLFGRIMNANQASIMPQVVARWCEQEGHDVNFICYTGPENLFEELPHDSDIVFIGAFTEAAILAYSISNVFRSRGAVTVLGGPHARCFPQDAVKYFDYVLGFTDRELIRDVLQDCTPNRPEGVSLSAGQQPAELPGVEERWKYIEQVHEKSRWIKGVSHHRKSGLSLHLQLLHRLCRSPSASRPRPDQE